MRKVVMLEHVSLDGYLAGPNGEMDWIRVRDDAFWDYTSAITAAADTALYGRVTYQMMEAYWPDAGDQPNATKHDIEHSRWVNAATKLVFSRTLTAVTWQNTRIVSGDIAGAIEELKGQPGMDLVLIGSPSIARELLRLGLVEDLWLNINPVILGRGISLFGDGDARFDLELEGWRTFDGGVVALHYRRA